MWFWWALASIIFSSLSAVLAKKVLTNVSTSVVSWSFFVINIPLVALIAASQGRVRVNSWFWLGTIGSAIIFSLAATLRLWATKRINLSQIAPLTTFNPVFSYLFALVILKEQLSLWSLSGIGLIISGAYLLNLSRVRIKWWKPLSAIVENKIVLIFLIGVLLSAWSGVFDKTAIINSFPNSPSLTLLVENILTGLIITGFLIIKKPGWLKEVKTNLTGLTILSLTYCFGSLLVFTAFKTGPVSLVLAVRQIQVLTVLLLSYLWFKDKPTRDILLGTVLMLAGAIVIRLG